MEMPRLLSLDLGTCYCRAAYTQYNPQQDRYNEPQLIEVQGRPALHLAVVVDPDTGDLLEYGDRAFEDGLASRHPTWVKTGFTPGLGAVPAAETWTEALLREMQQSMTLTLGQIQPQERVGLSLGTTSANAERYRQALTRAVEQAGIGEPEGVSEPLAVFAYHAAHGDLGRPLPPGRYFTIVSGALTTECGVVDVPPGWGRPQLTWALSERYGGDDFDQALAQYILARYAHRPGEEPDQVLRHFARSFKEVFSERLKSGEDRYEQYCPLAGFQMPVSLTRTEFEQVDLAGALIDRFAGIVCKALQKAGTQPEKIERVILAGGNVRWYFVQRAAEDIFDRSKVVIAARPEESVVKGAALALALALPQQGLTSSVVASDLTTPAVMQPAQRSQPASEVRAATTARNRGAHSSAELAVRPRAELATKQLSSPKKAFGLEMLGLLGFLGIGWIYSGRVLLGVFALAFWWLLLGAGIIGLVGLAVAQSAWYLALVAVYWLAVPLTSGLLAARSTRQRYLPRRGKAAETDNDA
jgi:hypothetical protein